MCIIIGRAETRSPLTRRGSEINLCADDQLCARVSPSAKPASAARAQVACPVDWKATRARSLLNSRTSSDRDSFGKVCSRDSTLLFVKPRRAFWPPEMDRYQMARRRSASPFIGREGEVYARRVVRSTGSPSRRTSFRKRYRWPQSERFALTNIA